MTYRFYCYGTKFLCIGIEVANSKGIEVNINYQIPSAYISIQRTTFLEDINDRDSVELLNNAGLEKGNIKVDDEITIKIEQIQEIITILKENEHLPCLIRVKYLDLFILI